MHHFIRAADIEPAPAFPDNASAYRRFALSDRSVGAVHTGWGLCALDAFLWARHFPIAARR